MEFKALSGKGTSTKTKSKRELPINLAIRLDRIEIGPDKPSFYHGFVVGSNEPVAVRMMTVEEGVAVNMREGEERETTVKRLTQQYVGTPERHRPRPQEINNASSKTHCEVGGLIMFSKALKNEDGTYRAHWVDVVEKSPGAGCDVVMAHIGIDDIRDKVSGDVTGVNVYADVIQPDAAVVLNKENALSTLSAVFANKDGEIERHPFMHVRLIDASTGNVVLTAKSSAEYKPYEKTDPDTGATIKGYSTGTPNDTIRAIFVGDRSHKDGLIVRAALFGLGDKPGYPEYKATDPGMIAELNQVTDAVRAGALQVEALPGERLRAGAQTKGSIAKAAKANANNPLNLYSKRNDNGFVTERRFTPTFLTTRIDASGARTFTKAIAADLYPKMETVQRIATVNDFKATAEAAQARAAEAKSDEVVVDEGMPFDPSALDGEVASEVDAKLSRSAAELDNDM